jgi:hypothetical protein
VAEITLRARKTLPVSVRTSHSPARSSKRMWLTFCWKRMRGRSWCSSTRRCTYCKISALPEYARDHSGFCANENE